jgi:hypothetical protein
MEVQMDSGMAIDSEVYDSPLDAVLCGYAAVGPPFGRDVVFFFFLDSLALQ